MKKTLPLIILFIGINCSLKAQDFVKYHGDDEKALINSAQTPDELIKLAFASELNGEEYQVLYGKFIQDVKQLNLESEAGDKSEKHIKKIYQLVHDRFLKTYNRQAHFGDFEVNGEYQYLSATILYAYILETLKIPYQITQLPSHTYVIANPGTDNIKFETVESEKPFYLFDDQGKQKNVTELIKTNYIDQSYAIRVGVERAFDDFFYAKPDITLKEAVGLLYFNKALFELQISADEAYSDICKSDILFPDKKNEYFKMEMMVDMVGNFKYDELKDWKGLTMLVNSKGANDETKKYIQGKFEDFLNNKLINAGQKDKVNEVYNYLHANIADTAVKKHISEDYFFQNAQYYYLTSDYAQALTNLETAYAINPNNPLIISNLVQMILHKYSAQTPSVQSLSSFNKYIDNYPSIKTNPVILSIGEYYLAFISVNGFSMGDGATGEKYLQLLMHQLDVNTNNSSNDIKFHQIVAGVFARASVYYWQKREKPKAIAVLKTGLKYEPTNEELLRKLRLDSGASF